MIVINKKVFAIVPDDDPIVQFMRSEEFGEPDYVEVITRETYTESCPLSVDPSGYKTTTTICGMNLLTAEEVYRGTAIWVCPD